LSPASIIKLKMKKIFVLIILSLTLFSCNDKQNFNIFFNKLKQESVIDSLLKADYFLQLRSPCGYDFELDSIRILFDFSFFKCKPVIGSVQKVTHDGIFNIEEYNKEELKSTILGYVNLMLKVGISGFHNIKKSYILIYFRLDDINESTLPEYSFKSNDDNSKDKLGVLVYDYTNKYVNLTQFSYYRPVEVAPKWYYYEVWTSIDCDCL